ncbi:MULTISPECIES: nucleoside diphosphate kinase regulator [Xanthomonas translucens group]|uniref:nucleoside diphosphate kinase regulator n=1 Tax=Xanthomonas translucens group TaxID=3390202 RepID=UPI000578FA4D|nr:nucleoside diphosphate kinase regulator [Xanthomonas translucens]UKE46520.1 nucleoside diphosphate kinase regulator [Xanthomonas translucens pv. cerealis]UKE68860.1 nucleoside diphosphate kinase regulator [Xanthomonas translucens pv. pistacia]
MSSQPQSGLPPSLIVSSHDLARLEALLESPALKQHPAALALGEELGRATVVPPEQIPAGIVAMHSRVECEDELHGERHQLTLVYPHEADAAQGRISVLAPVGSALLGLAVGQSIDWQAPGGRALRLRVLAVQAADAAARATR